MKLHRTIPIFVLLVAGVALAQSPEQLRERIATATRNNQVKLYPELARQLVERASREFSAGESEKGLASVEQAVAAAEKALEVTRETRRRIKQTEISIRKSASRLEDISRAASFEDRQKVDLAVKRMHEVRDELLALMFSREKK